MCFVFHKWSKWEQFKEEYAFTPGILSPKAVQGRFFTKTEFRQKRKYEECGKVQDVLVRDE